MDRGNIYIDDLKEEEEEEEGELRTQDLGI